MGSTFVLQTTILVLKANLLVVIELFLVSFSLFKAVKIFW